MAKSSTTREPTLERAAAFPAANAPSNSAHCTCGVNPKDTTTPVANAPPVTTVVVAGIDLTQYLKPPCEDTPFERFLKDENAIQRIASSPWLCRINKL